MAENKRNNVIIASVLKPQDDHRLFEKWGGFFKTNRLSQVHLFAQPNDSKKEDSFSYHNSIKKRGFFQRFICQIKFLQLLFSVKPEIVIICTFELLLMARFYSFFSRKTSFFYDVRENYALNISSQGNYHGLKKQLSLFFIRWSEKVSTRFITHFFYTDAIYKDQLYFLNQNSTLIENLFSFRDDKIVKTEYTAPTFLITGTISKAYGIELGLDWFKKIKQVIPTAELIILGHSTDNYSFDSSDSSIHLKTSSKPIPHATIINTIASVDFLLLPYLWESSFEGCTPTKLHEALYLNTKVIISQADHLKLTKSELIYFINPIEEDFHFLSNSTLSSNQSEKQKINFNQSEPILKDIFNPFFTI